MSKLSRQEIEEARMLEEDARVDEANRVQKAQARPLPFTWEPQDPPALP